MTNLIRAERLGKRFDRPSWPVTAVDALDLEIAPGEVFGFLGPNGAGKTTTVRMLCGLIGPSEGRAWVNGFDVATAGAPLRASIGVLTEQPGLYDRLSAYRNLHIYAQLYELPDPARAVEKYLRLLGLWERREDLAGSFSKGMKQKLAIARALLHEPATLFLDEPTSGLDPESAKLVRDFIASLKSEGRTIFLCTHNLEEADRLCDRVAVFRRRVIKLDTPSNLRRELFGRGLELRLRGAERFAQTVRELPFVKQVRAEGDALSLELDDPEMHTPELVRALVAAGADVLSVQESRRSLEDVYLSLIRQ